MEDAGQAFAGLTRKDRHPVHVDVLREECAAPVHHRRVPADQNMRDEATEILELWARALRHAG